jgi:hypothetical protein
LERGARLIAGQVPDHSGVVDAFAHQKLVDIAVALQQQRDARHHEHAGYHHGDGTRAASLAGARAQERAQSRLREDLVDAVEQPLVVVLRFEYQKELPAALDDIIMIEDTADHLPERWAVPGHLVMAADHGARARVLDPEAQVQLGRAGAFPERCREFVWLRNALSVIVRDHPRMWELVDPRIRRRPESPVEIQDNPHPPTVTSRRKHRCLRADARRGRSAA